MKLNTLINGLGILVLATLSASVFAAKYPACRPIMQACKAAGFAKNAALGHRLYKDCIIPVLTNQPQPVAGSLALPAITPSQVAACNAQRAAGAQPQATASPQPQ